MDIVCTDICITKLPINWLKEAKFTPVMHFHGIFARTVHQMVISASIMNDVWISSRVDWSQPWAHSHHNFGRLLACIGWVILAGRRLTWISVVAWLVHLLLFVVVFNILSIELTRLADSNPFTLSCDFNIRIYLTSNNNVVLHKFDCVILAVILWRVAAKLLWIKYFIAVTTLLSVKVWLCLDDLVTVVSIVLNLQVADLNDSIVLADIDAAHAEVDSSTSVDILRAYINIFILTTRRLWDIDWVFIAFFFLIRIDTRFRNVDWW